MRERAAHDAFAANRATGVVGRSEALAALDAHAAGSGPPLLVTGGAGIGKSSLLAAWALQHRRRHPRDLMVVHFAGATPQSASPVGLLRRLLAELGGTDDGRLAERRGTVDGDREPGNAIELRDRLAARLAALAAGGRRVVLVIAGLERLGSREGGLGLAWLPAAFPDQARVVLSSGPGAPADEIERRGWPRLELPPLPTGERHDFTARYLARYGKTLTTAQASRIESAPQTGNPLYLRTLLEELRIFGTFELVDARISHYLEATTPASLFTLVLDRCAHDYDGDRPGLTNDALSLLWAARHGLSEDELLELLGTDESPLPQAHWSPLFLALEGSLTSHAGLLRIGHPHLADAIAARCLPTTDHARVVHRRLADYFSARRPWRLLDELPWQLAQAGEWERLRGILTDPTTFELLWLTHEPDVMALWAETEAASDIRMADSYQSWAAGEIRCEAVGFAVDLLRGTGHLAEALTLSQRFADLAAASGDHHMVVASLDAQGALQGQLGQSEEALALFSREEALCRDAGDWAGAARALQNAANVLKDQGDLAAAVGRYERGAETWRAFGDRRALAVTLGNQASLLADLGDLDRAADLGEEAAMLSRELGDPIGLSTALGHLALVRIRQGDFTTAMSYLTQQEQILRQHGQFDSLPGCLRSQAAVREALGDLEGAIEVLASALTLARELGNRRSEGESLGDMGRVLVELGRHDEAMVLLDQQEAMARDLGLPRDLQACVGHKATILRARGDLDGALALLDEKARLCRQLGDQRSLAIALGNQGNIADTQGDADRALELYQEKKRIDRSLGNLGGLAHVLFNESSIRLNRQEYRQALPLIDEEVGLRRSLGNPHKLALALVHRTEGLAHLGNISEALAAAREAHGLAQENGFTDIAAHTTEWIEALRRPRTPGGGTVLAVAVIFDSHVAFAGDATLQGYVEQLFRAKWPDIKMSQGLRVEVTMGFEGGDTEAGAELDRLLERAVATAGVARTCCELTSFAAQDATNNLKVWCKAAIGH